MSKVWRPISIRTSHVKSLSNNPSWIWLKDFQHYSIHLSIISKLLSADTWNSMEMHTRIDYDKQLCIELILKIFHIISFLYIIQCWITYWKLNHITCFQRTETLYCKINTYFCNHFCNWDISWWTNCECPYLTVLWIGNLQSQWNKKINQKILASTCLDSLNYRVPISMWRTSRTFKKPANSYPLDLDSFSVLMQWWNLCNVQIGN